MDILLKYFPELNTVQLEQFRRLADLTGDWNRKINLISRKDIEHVIERHILHSLGIALHAPFRSGIRILDVGTGGGFPGLQLAIMFPDARFKGPAIIEERESTIVMGEDATARVDDFGFIWITLSQSSGADNE